MIVKLLTERHLEFLSLKGGCMDSSKSTHVTLLEITCHCSFGFNFLHLAKVLATPNSEPELALPKQPVQEDHMENIINILAKSFNRPHVFLLIF